MNLVYIGPFTEGDLDGIPFKRGAAVSVPPALAEKVLAEQDKNNPQWVDEGNPVADEAALRLAEQKD